MDYWFIPAQSSKPLYVCSIDIPCPCATACQDQKCFGISCCFASLWCAASWFQPSLFPEWRWSQQAVADTQLPAAPNHLPRQGSPLLPEQHWPGSSGESLPGSLVWFCPWVDYCTCVNSFVRELEWFGSIVSCCTFILWNCFESLEYLSLTESSNKHLLTRISIYLE